MAESPPPVTGVKWVKKRGGTAKKGQNFLPPRHGGETSQIPLPKSRGGTPQIPPPDPSRTGGGIPPPPTIWKPGGDKAVPPPSRGGKSIYAQTHAKWQAEIMIMIDAAVSKYI